MLWKRITHAFLLGAGISMVGAGCSAVNALVSSPAGHGADDSSPQRLVAIGRVFENQGQMNRATAMYRQAMKVDPGNSVAQERLQFIAGMDSSRSFSPSERRSQHALAMADSIQGNSKRGTRQTTKRRTDLDSALANEAVVASLQPAAATPFVKTAANEVTQSVTQVAGNVESGEAELISAFADDAGWVNVVDTGWELAQLVDSETTPEPNIQASRTPEINDQSAEIELVALDLGDNAVAGQVNVVSEWQPAVRAAVTLDEVAQCMDTPEAHAQLLVRALSQGEDEGVQALAATLLTECSQQDTVINSALQHAATDSSELIRLAASDALIQRSAMTDAGIEGLLSLLTSSNSEIRIQTAASLRNCVQTQWGSRCVQGLSRMLSQQDPAIVAVAASTLGDFGQLAAGQVDTLRQLGESDNALVVEAAQTALGRIQLQSAGQQQDQLSPVDVTAVGQYLPVVE